MQGYINGMQYSFTQTQILVAAFVLTLVIVIAIAALVDRRKNRTLAFRNRFGTEYDRAVLTHGSSGEAEAKLADREVRVEALKIRDLGLAERDHFVTEWHIVQSRFVDHPTAAVTEADDLVNALLVARGYPHAGFEQRAADVSVSYPRVMENYRLAHAVAMRPGNAEATTEELRTTIIRYRAIFDELVRPQEPAGNKSAA